MQNPRMRHALFNTLGLIAQYACQFQQMKTHATAQQADPFKQTLDVNVVNNNGTRLANIVLSVYPRLCLTKKYFAQF